jgi:hypothetical protein
LLIIFCAYRTRFCRNNRLLTVKTQKQVIVLQNKAQKDADKLNEEDIFITKGVQHIQVQAGKAYQLNAKDFDAKKSSLNPQTRT